MSAYKCPGKKCHKVYNVFSNYEKHFLAKHGDCIQDAIIVPKKQRKRRKLNKAIVYNPPRDNVVSNPNNIPETILTVGGDDSPLMENPFICDQETWEARFNGVRKTDNGEYDVLRVIQIVRNVSRPHAITIWNRLCKSQNTPEYRKHNFRNGIGRLTKPVPVMTLSQIIGGLMPYLPGELGKKMVRASAQLAIRVASGDPDVRVASRIQEARLSSDLRQNMMSGLSSSTSSTQDVELISITRELEKKEKTYQLANYEKLKNLDMLERQSKVDREKDRMDVEKQKLELAKQKLISDADVKKKKIDADKEVQLHKDNNKHALECKKANLKNKSLFVKALETTRTILLSTPGGWDNLSQIEYVKQIKDEFKLNCSSNYQIIMSIVFDHLGNDTDLEQANEIFVRVNEQFENERKRANRDGTSNRETMVQALERLVKCFTEPILDAHDPNRLLYH